MENKERVALITGASSGLGEEYFKQLANEPTIDSFWVIARRKEKLEALKRYTTKPVYVLPLDLTKPESFETIAQVLEQRNGVIQYLIANAGMGRIQDTKDTSIQDTNFMIDLNIKAVLHTITLCIPYMHKGSSILIVSSMTSYQPLPGFNLYASTKAFLRSYSYALHEELKPMGISVTCVCPYWISDTEFIGIAQNTNSSSYGTIVFPVKSSFVAKKSLSDLKKNRYVSSPGFISSAQRVLVHVFPTGTITRFMNKIRK